MAKQDRILGIFRSQPTSLFTSKKICYEYNRQFLDIIDKSNTSKWLNYLWKNGKILRTPTQVTEGYVYSLSAKSDLARIYDDFLVPPPFQNRSKLLRLIKNPYSGISKGNKLLYPKIPERYPGLTSKDLAVIAGFLMCDGNLKKNLRRLTFTIRHIDDAKRFKKYFMEIFPMHNLSIISKQGCYDCVVNSVDLGNLFYELGIPKGDKVHQEFLIPDWIFYGAREVKLSFLSIIYGNEGSKPSGNRWRVQFVLSKEARYVENLLHLLNQIKSMLLEFGITTTNIQLRKQEGRSFYGRFYFKGQQNMHKFYNLMSFLYASEKQIMLEDLILKGHSLKSATV
ncbi:MAG: hypothetical protein KJ601_04400 [Nanoarchaeota archaeon]|nr:hypothetical protein [Nanoarchaeota archaeon]MBU1704820.1 hypothetical protein [Nanoarchaeota archaeon]